ncbi:hypothetical protein BJY52DRAFT_841035 [Lactarius psammicola]|nr:hypothetical protein BJY52DRAFT_841035 [Lactarius psammicola]
MNRSGTSSTPTEEYPSDFYLERKGDGWSCKKQNKRFRVVKNVIKIKQSDAKPENVPTEQQRHKMYDESGNFSQHVQQYQGDHIFQLWVHKIGPYLADWVFDKRSDNDPTAHILPWKLIGFPPGYTLWVHLTGDKSDPANPRTDAYLYGSPHKIFRSPMEFVEHAIWLMKSGSASVQCLCKYCTPGQNQIAINRRLNHRDDDESDEEEDGGNNSDGAPAATIAAINASRHPIFRNRRGAGAIAAAAATSAARQERRVARRDERSPLLIKAKDYRVGNTGEGGSGGPAV